MHMIENFYFLMMLDLSFRARGNMPSPSFAWCEFAGALRRGPHPWSGSPKLENGESGRRGGCWDARWRCPSCQRSLPETGRVRTRSNAAVVSHA